MNTPASQAPQVRPGTLAFLLAAALLSTVVVLCGGLAVGVMFYLAKRATAFNRRVDAAIAQVQQISGSSVVGSPATSSPVMPPGFNDWWVQRSLAPVYPAAIDAVASHPAVIDRLGEPIEPLQKGDEVYRIQRGGEDGAPLIGPAGNYELPKSQTIEFDIKGPQGAALVSVKAETVSPQYGGTYRATQITVKLSDGVQIDVPPPKEQAGTEIQ
jgi:hypothetical protein